MSETTASAVAPAKLPYYRPTGEEVALFEMCFNQRLPLLLKGPTGCGKSRFVAYMAAKLGRPLMTIACHEDTSAVDLLGRYLIHGSETIWMDGPLTRAVRQGAILYLDEIVEARPDVMVVIHPLTDHRRELYLDRRDEVLQAGPEFMLVSSFNPGFRQSLKTMKTSTRQRFVAQTFQYPNPDIEAEILVGETQIDRRTAKKLVGLANRLRKMDSMDLGEIPSTRLLVDAAKLLCAGLDPRFACQAAIVEPLTDEPDSARAMMDLVAFTF